MNLRPIIVDIIKKKKNKLLRFQGGGGGYGNRDFESSMLTTDKLCSLLLMYTTEL